MRLIGLITMAVFTISFQVEAKSPKDFDGRIISYQTFMSLSPKKRIDYLRDLRELLVLMEKNQIRYEVASNDNSLNELKEHIATMMRMVELMPQAVAQDAPAAPADTTRASVPSWNSETRAWECLGPSTQFVPALGTCVLKINAARGVRPSLDITSGKCPEGTVGVHSRSTWASKFDHCIPQESWDALSTTRRKEISKGVRLPANFFENESADETRAWVHGGGTHDNSGMALGSTGGPSRPPSSAGGAIVPPLASASPGATPKPPVSPEKPPEKPQDKPPSPPPASSGDQCRLPELACGKLVDNSKEKNSLIQQFRRDRNSNVCVNGGFFSQYQSADKRAGKCKWVREVKLLKGTKQPSCDKPNHDMCNPTVFCLGLKLNDATREKFLKDENDKRAGKPPLTAADIERAFKPIEGSNDKIIPIFYCAPRNQNLTAQCNNLMQAHLDGKAGKPGYTGKGFEYVACDPSRVQGIPLQDEWKKLTDETHRLYRAQCGDSKQTQFQALFCEECKVIGERIFAMNRRAIGTGCASDSVSSPSAPPAGSGEGRAIREEG